MTSRLIVQHIVLPIDEFEGTEDLYTKEGIKGFPIRLSSGDSVDLRTYFNFFPSERYRTYAGINSIKLKLECEGTPVIEIHRCDVDSDDFERLSYLEGMEIELKEECLLGLVIRAEDSDVTINGGHFYVETEKVNKIHLAHIICTYHRETEVKNKLDLICRILRNYPFIEDDYSLYVVDNGRSFQYDDDLVKVIPSDNYGGSGGFSRGMIEAINDGISTHVVLNDDDAVLDPEVIYRTISFYKLISEEKKETILGGTIFDKGHPLTIHEAGAYYDNGVLRAYDDMDPMTVEGCISADQSLKGGTVWRSRCSSNTMMSISV